MKQENIVMDLLMKRNTKMMMMKSTTRDNNKEDNMNGPFFTGCEAMRADHYEHMGCDPKTVEPYYKAVKSNGGKPTTEGVEVESEKSEK
jgi:hypothetical protein